MFCSATYGSICTNMYIHVYIEMYIYIHRCIRPNIATTRIIIIICFGFFICCCSFYTPPHLPSYIPTYKALYVI